MISVVLGSAAIASMTMSWPLRSISAPVETTSGPATLAPPWPRRGRAARTGRDRPRCGARGYGRRACRAPPCRASSPPDTASSPSRRVPAARTWPAVAGGHAPMVDVAAARLDRHRHAEALAQRDCGGAVGKEERRRRSRRRRKSRRRSASSGTSARVSAAAWKRPAVPGMAGSAGGRRRRLSTARRAATLASAGMAPAQR